ncbi:MAG TPA: ribonuclease III [Syntrophales bacterium]|nr:ribonuclease III [Syntrophales bacterium]
MASWSENEEWRAGIDRLSENLDYRFRDRSRLETAVVHRSFLHENPGAVAADNERLEFLGDAVLQLVVSDLLMKRFPDAQEGLLSRLRASAVNEQQLAELAKSIRLGDCLLLGRGEDLSGGRTKISILADAMEALIGAVYSDGGFGTASAVVGRLYEPFLAGIETSEPWRDFKGALQEWSRIRFGEMPRYEVAGETGPDHDKTFEVKLSVGDREVRASGRSKKEAEQNAARRVLKDLEAGGETQGKGDHGRQK